MRALLAAALCLAALPARAHQQTVSYSDLRIEGAHVHGTLRFAMADLRTQMVLDEAHPNAPALAALIGLVVQGDGKACAADPEPKARVEEGDGVILEEGWTCPAPFDELSVKAPFLDTFPSGHTHLAKITFADGFVAQRALQLEEPSFQVREQRSFWREAARFVRLGVEHIFTGYDHIAFLIALLLLGGTLRRLIGIVTAFTLAHSITLALASLEVLTPSSRLIEPAIAASIVYVGLENLWALRKGRDVLGHRWMLTFAFGLIHGFGFASVLRELHLPRAALATGLVSFNLGVEAGQICIVALALPILRRVRLGTRGVAVLSGLIAALGLFWLLQRLL